MSSQITGPWDYLATTDQTLSGLCAHMVIHRKGNQVVFSGFFRPENSKGDETTVFTISKTSSRSPPDGEYDIKSVTFQEGQQDGLRGAHTKRHRRVDLRAT